MNHLPQYLVAFLAGACAYKALLQWNARVRIRRAKHAGYAPCRECGHIDP